MFWHRNGTMDWTVDMLMMLMVLMMVRLVMRSHNYRTTKSDIICNRSAAKRQRGIVKMRTGRL